jgi:hypothetical protein
MHFALLCVAALAGVALAQSFKVFVLVPASIVVIVIAASLEYKIGASPLGIISWSALAVVALNLGYGLWILDLWSRPPPTLIVITVAFASSILPDPLAYIAVARS